jgi:hypothetical protein
MQEGVHTQEASRHLGPPAPETILSSFVSAFHNWVVTSSVPMRSRRMNSQLNGNGYTRTVEPLKGFAVYPQNPPSGNPNTWTMPWAVLG